MKRRWLIRILLFSGLHYLALVLLNSFIFLLAHVPPEIVNLDKVIVLFTYLYQTLTLPRSLLRFLWWGEATPTALNWTLAIINSVLWGALLTWFTRRRWLNAWENAA